MWFFSHHILYISKAYGCAVKLMIVQENLWLCKFTIDMIRLSFMNSTNDISYAI